MSHGNRVVRLANSVAAFRATLPIDDLERFNEIIVKLHNDPYGKRSGAIQRSKPPLIYYSLAYDPFVISYLVAQTSQGARVEIFAVRYQ